ncbi:hypothetical protein ACQ5SO_17185 [Rhodovulum sp. DZ06]|uniref:hypothetical protein n=1 Tax=Rhodovulum sp. DZ06 TaxID=3425126 RepID=UPI003D353DAD
MLDAAPAALQTRNAYWGFYGSASRWDAPAAEPAWALAFAGIARRTGGAPEAVRDFLDSRAGRHFADEVENQLAGGRALAAATEAAIERYMGWRVGRSMSRETGIPAGLPLLTALVAQAEIEADEE